MMLEVRLHLSHHHRKQTESSFQRSAYQLIIVLFSKSDGPQNDSWGSHHSPRRVVVVCQTGVHPQACRSSSFPNLPDLHSLLRQLHDTASLCLCFAFHDSSCCLVCRWLSCVGGCHPRPFTLAVLCLQTPLAETTTKRTLRVMPSSSPPHYQALKYAAYARQLKGLHHLLSTPLSSCYSHNPASNAFELIVQGLATSLSFYGCILPHLLSLGMA